MTIDLYRVTSTVRPYSILAEKLASRYPRTTKCAGAALYRTTTGSAAGDPLLPHTLCDHHAHGPTRFFPRFPRTLCGTRLPGRVFSVRRCANAQWLKFRCTVPIWRSVQSRQEWVMDYLERATQESPFADASRSCEEDLPYIGPFAAQANASATQSSAPTVSTDPIAARHARSRSAGGVVSAIVRDREAQIVPAAGLAMVAVWIVRYPRSSCVVREAVGPRNRMTVRRDFAGLERRSHWSSRL